MNRYYPSLYTALCAHNWGTDKLADRKMFRFGKEKWNRRYQKFISHPAQFPDFDDYDTVDLNVENFFERFRPFVGPFTPMDNIDVKIADAIAVQKWGVDTVKDAELYYAIVERFRGLKIDARQRRDGFEYLESIKPY